METKPFQSLQTLEVARQEVKISLGKKYAETIQPLIELIQTIMKARGLDKFEAMKFIKDELPIYKQKNAPAFFSAALMEMVERDHF